MYQCICDCVFSLVIWLNDVCLMFTFFMKGNFSYDSLFANLVNRLLPSFVEEEPDSMDGLINISTNDSLSSWRSSKGLSSPLFSEVDTLLLIFKDSCTQLLDLRKQVVDIDFIVVLHLLVSFIHQPFFSAFTPLTSLLLPHFHIFVQDWWKITKAEKGCCCTRL